MAGVGRDVIGVKDVEDEDCAEHGRPARARKEKESHKREHQKQEKRHEET